MRIFQGNHFIRQSPRMHTNPLTLAGISVICVLVKRMLCKNPHHGDTARPGGVGRGVTEFFPFIFSVSPPAPAVPVGPG
jgi:hypothetical protein